MSVIYDVGIFIKKKKKNEQIIYGKLNWRIFSNTNKFDYKDAEKTVVLSLC